MHPILATQFALARQPTPVFNTPHLQECFGGSDGDSLQLDDQQLLRSVETVLLPHSKIELLEKINNSAIWRIRTNEYSYSGDFFTDERFLELQSVEPKERTVILPSINDMIHTSEKLIGARYVWGGNWPTGIGLLPTLYPPKSSLSQLPVYLQDTWQLKGVDCSGLLYFLSDGFTPRNTSSLLHFGHPVSIEGKNVEQIIAGLQAFDLIVWKGHVVCVYQGKQTIESRADHGVIVTDLHTRLSEIVSCKIPIDESARCTQNHFVIRRWHPETI